MDLSKAAAWEPPAEWLRLGVIDSHTGGEPFRVVVDGLPDIPGETVLARRRYAQQNLDHIRRVLMWEPRGHADMYGGWIGDPVSPESDMSILFLHNEGFSTMCGHGIIALAKVAHDTGLVPTDEAEAQLRVDTPAGMVHAVSTVEDGRVTATRFRNVPSFTLGLDQEIEVFGLGRVNYDLAFGGAFYAYVDATSLGLAPDDVAALVSAGRMIKEAVATRSQPDHPEDPELGFIYGVVFTWPSSAPGIHSRHLCVFAEGEVDRSPTGTAVSGRLAILDSRGQIEQQQTIAVESITGSTFTGRIVDHARVGDHPAVIPEVGGSAHITGRAQYWVDPIDELGRGFLLR